MHTKQKISTHFDDIHADKTDTFEQVSYAIAMVQHTIDEVRVYTTRIVEADLPNSIDKHSPVV